MRGYGYLSRFQIISRIVAEFRRNSELNDGLLIYGLLLVLLFSPLWPLDLVLLLVLALYVFYKNGFTPLTHSVVIVYLLFSFTSYNYIGFIILSAYLSILMLCSKKYSLLAGSFILYILLFMMLETSHYLLSYYSVLCMYLSGDTYELIGLHLVILSVLILYTAMYTPFLRTSRIGGYFVENPGAYPVIQFMILLIYAAVLLVFNNEALANKVAELAYYSLVLGVLFSLKQVVSEKESTTSQENTVS